MLIVLFILCIILLSLGIKLTCKFDGDEPKGVCGMIICIIDGGISFAILIMLILGIVTISQASIINDKISLYETENSQIQEDITIMVSEYAKWEADTYEKFAQADPMFIINMYPDLKTNELVNTQLEIYIQNKQEIKCLKETKLDYEVWKWWVYFG